jgi:hypothetical protein
MTLPTDQVDYRSRESFDYARDISLPWGELEQVLAWSRQELTGEWRWQLISSASDLTPGRYIFYFDESRDAMAFSLKWC